jgi:hypothetical protein
MKHLGLFLIGIFLSTSGISAEIIDDAANAQRLMMKARFLTGHQPTTQAPGHHQYELNNRRGGPHAAHYQGGACGSVSIGNVQPVIGDHRQHQTFVIINGHIYNSGNQC